MSNENAPEVVAGMWAARGPSSTVPNMPPQNNTDEKTPEVNITTGLAEQLQRAGYHPVMLFGTRSSGKTTLLTSLFAFANTDVTSPGSVSLGEPLLSLDTEEGKKVDNHVRRIFNEHVLNFADGIPAPITSESVRIFMPIIFTPNRRRSGIKIAFLESSGEDYTVRATNAGYFPKLKDEIVEVYKNFPGSISVIIAAPYLLESEHSAKERSNEEQRQEEIESDRGLYAALQNYQEHRNPRYRHQDRFLFILTKWDEHTKGVNEKAFLNPPPHIVIDIITKKFEKSWIFFQKLKNIKVKNVLVYSAGIMTGEIRLNTPEKHRGTMSIFPRKLWNWIIRGAKNDKYDQFFDLFYKLTSPIVSFFRKLFM